MRISIDIDGVLAVFTGQGGLIQPIANKLWPGIMPEGYQPPDWDHTDIFVKRHWNELWKEIRSTPNFWEGASAYDRNVQDLATFLHTEPVEVLFVTSRAATAGDPVSLQTVRWMLKNGLPVVPVPYPNQDFNYSPIVVVPNSKLKKQIMEGLEITHSVDDLGPTVQACNEIPGHTAYVLDRPWNRDKEYGPRVKDLKEFLDIVKESK